MAIGEIPSFISELPAGLPRATEVDREIHIVAPRDVVDSVPEIPHFFVVSSQAEAERRVAYPLPPEVVDFYE